MSNWTAVKGFTAIGLRLANQMQTCGTFRNVSLLEMFKMRNFWENKLPRLRSYNRHLFTLFLVSFLVIGAYLKFGSTNELPAWIQAGGSVLAIIASSWIASHDKVSRQNDRRKDVLAVAEAAHHFSKKIRDIIDSSCSKEGMVNVEIYNVYHNSVVNSYAKALGNIPFHEVGSSTAVQALLAMQVQFSELLGSSIEKLLQGVNSNVDFQKGASAYDHYPEPQRTEMIAKLKEVHFKVLSNNVKVHLDVIEKSFLTLKNEMII
ncbi:hypothetical protein F3X86_20420 [Aeromonas veronii]|uniref:hypothetical protein n=2 Tax=Aeromonas TaxID=642 RepID=UPI001245FDF1|nr:hypothetical protein [Aeromonas veronii]KAB0663196.1 hypothetical protein F3X86_20420 [Aeromonas veronii]